MCPTSCKAVKGDFPFWCCLGRSQVPSGRPILGQSFSRTGLQSVRQWARKWWTEGFLLCFCIMFIPNKVVKKKLPKDSIRLSSIWPSSYVLAWRVEYKIFAVCAPHLACSLCPRVCCLLSHWGYLTKRPSLGKIAYFNQSTKWASLDDLTKCTLGEFCTAMSGYQVIKWKGK